ncbi:MAG: flagellar hook protein FlgE [Nitrospira sp.]
MGILTGMFTAVTGLNSYGNAMSVIGNNIANVGTIGFKSSRATFAELVSASLAAGAGSDQIGLGVFMNDVQANFTQGSLTTTGKTFDLAIDGNGFYLLNDSAGAGFYSRDGQFKVNNQGQIVNAGGFLLQGYQADANGNITNTVDNITLTSNAVPPQITSTASIRANLDANATAPTGAFNVSDPTTYNFSTGLPVYDSLGNAQQLRLYFVKTSTANTWNLYSQVGSAAAVAQTNLAFNASGALTSGGSQAMSLVIPGGATTPQTVTVDFSNITQFGSPSGVIDQVQNGFAAGTLDRISVDAQGKVVAQFTNGVTRALAQVVLNRFVNPEGLAKGGDNLFIESIESGAPLSGAATTNGLGKVVSGAVEQSNVDLGKEFVDMIITQRAFQANSRAITTSDEMLQELVNLKR